MYKVELQLENESGLHARPASMFVKEANKFSSEINIIKEGNKYNAKSIMSILSMGAKCGDKIIIEAEGYDEKESIQSLKGLIISSFGE
ncbi:HPr family phosphocarrier protein [Sporosalibacterium faouarense]|uniref:HPr family phosphocarrier protein n=1 Tax=Sporosalibacterium faouarense TaxID=516123 RepID=UPI00141D63B9|nr:HPr family phosphocarrier protein [Sporosalibacterium faouarense]MTI46595.1 HPr family phosphocarrier protein [Bacillota bacterium]